MSNTFVYSVLSIAICILVPTNSAFSTPHKITVQPVTTRADVVALADLRYDEWILSSHTDEKDSQFNNVPSRYAFRMATADLAAERSEATAFLARLNDTTVVGAAELSPMEFEGALDPTCPQACLYVTDVVTSSQFRRMGIANALMDAIEQSAYDRYGDGTLLFLHVKADNVAAQKFYSRSGKRGYSLPTADQLQGIRVNRLEENAGTNGQILLCKTLQLRGQQRKQLATTSHRSSIGRPEKYRAVGAGFGMANAKTHTKKSKRKKK